MARKQPSRVREASLADVPQMAEVIEKGFYDDDVFGRFMHPRRAEYPDDWVRWWHKECRSWIVKPEGVVYVGVDEETNRVLAFCVMARIGTGEAALVASETYMNKARRWFVASQNALEAQTWKSRAADFQNIETFDKNWDDICHYFTGPRADCWMIEILCVHPDAQKKGFGRELIQNAIQKCENENPPLPLALIASEIGDAFYEKQGFREAGRANVGGLKDVKGGSLKFYENHLSTPQQ